MTNRQEDYRKILSTAAGFVSWYRQMVIEGQIETTDYAKQFKPCDDYNLASALEFYAKELEEKDGSHGS